MGTDIHLAVEARKNGEWINMTPFKNEDGYLSNYPNGYYEDRNYDLFAMLADVRNGSGFAGLKTGDGFIPLTSGRGIPADASPDVRLWAEDGDHSHSFCTVDELINYDWTQKTRKSGIVSSLTELARFKLNGRPKSWSGGIGGPGIVVFETPADLAMVDVAVDRVAQANSKDRSAVLREMLWHGGDGYGDLKPDAPVVVHEVNEELKRMFGCERPCFRVEWEISYFESANAFLAETMPKLWRLGAPEDVRLVFWFDS